MRLREEFRYDAPPARVWAALTDPGVHEALAQRVGAIRSRVEVSDLPAGGRRVSADWQLALPPEVPDFARRFAGPTLTVDRVDEWGAISADGGASGRIVVRVQGLPVHLVATLTLTPGPGPEGPGTCHRVVAQLTAHVPLIGRRLEQAAAPAVTSALAEEHRAVQDWLAGTG